MKQKSVYTIGYEGTDIDRFVASLQNAGVKVLADVRAVAVSRKRGFSKTALRERLTGVRIEYRHFRQLGDPKPGREAARAGQFEEFRSIYAAHLQTAAAQLELRELAELSRLHPTCMMCFERDPQHCHRRLVGNALSSYNLSQFDLYGDWPERYVNNEQLLPRHYISESASAA